MLLPLMFFGVLFLFAVAIWIVSLYLFLAARSSKNRVFRIGGKAPFFIVNVLGLMLVGIAVFSSLSNDNPENIFKTEFGFSPSSDVRNLNSFYFSFGDTDSTLLQFQAAPATLNRIAASEFSRLNSAQILAAQNNGSLEMKDADDPPWWKPQITSKTIVWKGKVSRSEHSSQQIWLLYDRVTQWAHFYYLTID